MMPDFAQFFEQALAEHGVDAKVLHREKPSDDTFTIVKKIGNEKLSYRTTINTRINVTEDEIKKEIASSARKVADKIEKHLTEKFVWNGNAVIVSTYEDGWAECQQCRERVELPNRAMGAISFERDAELSTPQPLPKDRESRLNDMDDQSRLLLKIYLIGRLRRSCGHDCSTNWLNNTEKSDSYKCARFALDESDQKQYL